jgi:hypothetical protein
MKLPTITNLIRLWEDSTKTVFTKNFAKISVLDSEPINVFKPNACSNASNIHAAAE